MSRIFFRTIGVVLLLAPSFAKAHDPLDISSRMTVFDDRIELVSTLGVDAMREFLRASGFSAEEIAERLRALGPDKVVTYKPALAARMFVLEKAGSPVEVRQLSSRSEGMEIFLTLVCARPASGTLEARAVCYETIPELRPGVLIVDDESAGPLGAARLSRDKISLAVSLPVAGKKTKASAGAP